MEPAPNTGDWLERIQRGQIDPATAQQLRQELRERPAEATQFEEELRLEAALRDLPVVPVSTNFTARVLNEIERQEVRVPRRVEQWSRWLWVVRFLRPAAVALLALALTGWWQLRLRDRHTLASSVSAVSGAAAVPGLEWLTDFDAIQLLRTPAQPGDVELIAALASP